MCKKNNDCLGKVVAFMAGDLLPMKAKKRLDEPVPIRRSYLNYYIGRGYLMASQLGIACDEQYTLHCDKTDPNDQLVYKKAQKIIEDYALGGEIKPNCPPKLKAPDLPTRMQLQMAINTFRTSLNGKKLDSLKDDAINLT